MTGFKELATRIPTALLAVMVFPGCTTLSDDDSQTGEMHPSTNDARVSATPNEVLGQGLLEFVYPMESRSLIPESRLECRYMKGLWVMWQTLSVRPRLVYTGAGEIASARAELSAEGPDADQMIRLFDRIDRNHAEGLSIRRGVLISENVQIVAPGPGQDLTFAFPLHVPAGDYQLQVVVETTD